MRIVLGPREIPNDNKFSKIRFGRVKTLCKGQQILCGYIKNKPDRGFGLFPNSVIRVLRDKMNTLGERRFWTDLQEEKRNPGKEIEEKVSEEKLPEEAQNDTEEIIENVTEEKAEPEPDVPIEQPLDTKPVDQKIDPVEAARKAEEAARLAEEAEAERLRKLEEEAMRNLRPLQKTSQIWRWIDDMLDDQFVERLGTKKYIVWCVFPAVVVSRLPHAEFRPTDHREDASHFI